MSKSNKSDDILNEKKLTNQELVELLGRLQGELKTRVTSNIDVKNEIPEPELPREISELLENPEILEEMGHKICDSEIEIPLKAKLVCNFSFVLYGNEDFLNEQSFDLSDDLVSYIVFEKADLKEEIYLNSEAANYIKKLAKDVVEEKNSSLKEIKEFVSKLDSELKLSTVEMDNIYQEILDASQSKDEKFVVAETADFND